MNRLPMWLDADGVGLVITTDRGPILAGELAHIHAAAILGDGEVMRFSYQPEIGPDDAERPARRYVRLVMEECYPEQVAELPGARQEGEAA